MQKSNENLLADITLFLVRGSPTSTIFLVDVVNSPHNNPSLEFLISCSSSSLFKTLNLLYVLRVNIGPESFLFFLLIITLLLHFLLLNSDIHQSFLVLLTVEDIKFLKGYRFHRYLRLEGYLQIKVFNFYKDMIKFNSLPWYP